MFWIHQNTAQDFSHREFTMAPTKVMLIPHAEKPQRDHSAAGVGKHGDENSRDLTVTGWQRAGALARFFSPYDGHFVHSAIARPETIFAAGAGPGSKSRRARQTVEPLSKLIEIEIT